jgi:hypothetical protein
MMIKHGVVEVVSVHSRYVCGDETVYEVPVETTVVTVSRGP